MGREGWEGSDGKGEIRKGRDKERVGEGEGERDEGVRDEGERDEGERDGGSEG